MPISYLLMGDIRGFVLHLLLILPALVIALSFHEAAHAWMTNKMGDPTAKNLGRLTLDPTKHFDWWGLLTFALFGLGWGKPVPTNPRNYRNYKKANILVALSGVAMNFVLFLATMLIIAILNWTGVSWGASSYSNLLYILYLILVNIAYLNLLLCIFNLIPIPPLDGHHLVKGFIARKSPQFYMYYQRYGFFALLILLFAVPWFRTGLWWIVDTVFNAFAGLLGM
jgi:Zn-dependent protease